MTKHVKIVKIELRCSSSDQGYPVYTDCNIHSVAVALVTYLDLSIILHPSPWSLDTPSLSVCPEGTKRKALRSRKISQYILLRSGK